jgi:hypothetical protein
MYVPNLHSLKTYPDLAMVPGSLAAQVAGKTPERAEAAWQLLVRCFRNLKHDAHRAAGADERVPQVGTVLSAAVSWTGAFDLDASDAHRVGLQMLKAMAELDWNGTWNWANRARKAVLGEYAHYERCHELSQRERYVGMIGQDVVEAWKQVAR